MSLQTLLKTVRFFLIRNIFCITRYKILTQSENSLLKIKGENQVDYNLPPTSTDSNSNNNNEKETTGRASYREMFSDKQLNIFVFGVFFFHLANAPVLPLLGQVLALGSGPAGTPYTCANLVLAQLTSILTAYVMTHMIEVKG